MKRAHPTSAFGERADAMRALALAQEREEAQFLVMQEMSANVQAALARLQRAERACDGARFPARPTLALLSPTDNPERAASSDSQPPSPLPQGAAAGAKKGAQIPSALLTNPGAPARARAALAATSATAAAAARGARAFPPLPNPLAPSPGAQAAGGAEPATRPTRPRTSGTYGISAAAAAAQPRGAPASVPGLLDMAPLRHNASAYQRREERLCLAETSLLAAIAEAEARDKALLGGLQLPPGWLQAASPPRKTGSGGGAGSSVWSSYSGGAGGGGSDHRGSGLGAPKKQ
jgi:hypothetical protein